MNKSVNEVREAVSATVLLLFRSRQSTQLRNILMALVPGGANPWHLEGATRLLREGCSPLLRNNLDHPATCQCRTTEAGAIASRSQTRYCRSTMKITMS